MTEDEVVGLVGQPLSSGPFEETAENGTRIDHVAFYGQWYRPEDMRIWDTFEVSYARGKVVQAGAYRIFDGVPYQLPGSGNPRVAFMLRKDPSKPDEEVRPVVGPAMGEVFNCGTRGDGK
jgi:hypothetical protein